MTTAQATWADDVTGDPIRSDQCQHRRCSPQASTGPRTPPLRNLFTTCFPKDGPTLVWIDQKNLFFPIL